MKILVINSGSSSLKYQLYNMVDESVLVKGKVERIGMDTAILSHECPNRPEVTIVAETLDHTAAFRRVITALTHPEYGVIDSIDEIEAVGHRVVHGGESFSSSVIVNAEVRKEIRRLFDLAPLHNPAHMMGIDAVEVALPHISQVVVFDTAFHQSMPPESYLYPIPMVLYNKHMVRRYGFHGTSHSYVSEQAAKFLNRPIEQLKMVSCHIGNGASCAAIMNGKSYDTSMGMTPLEGLMMGTRSGDLDPAIVPYVMSKEDLTINEVNSMLNKHSGLIAISGISSDVREVEQAMNAGNSSAKLAYDMYVYRLRKYIGAYTAAMDGLDVLIFTAGVGENSSIMREKVCAQLSFFGVQLDLQANSRRERNAHRISTPESRVEVLVIPTNEELVIARDTYQLIAKGNLNS